MKTTILVEITVEWTDTRITAHQIKDRIVHQILPFGEWGYDLPMLGEHAKLETTKLTSHLSP